MVDFGNLTGGYKNYVMLELARRAADGSKSGDLEENRIGLLCTQLDINTNKQSLPIPIPFSGVISGESTTIALDAGMASKTVSLSGIILDQKITKQNKHGTQFTQQLTAFEIGQLIHSYVDSSFLHEDQNLSKLIVLMPSRVDTNFEYHSGVNENTPLEECPLIPFTWANRDYDIPQTKSGTKLSFGGTPWPEIIANDAEIPGLTGFIQDFSCSFNGAELPAITFTMSFTQASTAISDFINAGF